MANHPANLHALPARIASIHRAATTARGDIIPEDSPTLAGDAAVTAAMLALREDRRGWARAGVRV